MENEPGNRQSGFFAHIIILTIGCLIVGMVNLLIATYVLTQRIQLPSKIIEGAQIAPLTWIVFGGNLLAFIGCILMVLARPDNYKSRKRRRVILILQLIALFGVLAL